jgi:hypothetical protein
MKQIINFSQFCDGFSDTRKNDFSYEGKKALFEYIEDYEREAGEEVEYDPIALCCEYAEYEDLDEIRSEYEETKDMDDKDTLEWLRSQTTVIEVDGGGVIILQF